jgi:putative glycosyl hydrolase-like family 15 (GHL15) protein
MPAPTFTLSRALAPVALAGAAIGAWLTHAPSHDPRHRVAGTRPVTPVHSARPAPATARPFFRAVYGGYGGTPLSPAREGARYRVMILHYYDRRTVRRLKAANPGLRVLMYADMMSSDLRDPRGVADWAGYRNVRANHPGWFLRDRNGAPLVFKDYPASRVMDVGNRAYQNAGASRVIRLARAGGFDGIFLDDANASLRWVIPGGAAACVTYPTTPGWQSAVYSFLSNVGRQLHHARLLAVANIGGSTITPGLWQKWNGPLDGAMEESFTNGGTGADSVANGRWPAKLSHALWSERHGKLSLDHAMTATRAGARYALATMLLVGRRENLFSASVGYSREVWWPEYATVSSLGAPLAPYRKLRDGVYRRDFAKGVVLVNPEASAAPGIRLRGAYSGSGLRLVTRVSLGPASGLVLVKATRRSA